MTTTTANLNLRSTGSTGGSILLEIPKGASVLVGAKQSTGWHRAFYKGKAGWVSGYYLKDVTPVAFIDAAFPHLGKWYIIGGNGPDTFDCSGLTLYVLRTLKFPGSGPDATANAQMYKFRTGEWKGRKVAMKDAQPGDMVFYGYWKTENGVRKQHASHVTFAITPDWVMGANGGYQATKTIADAKRVGANVRIDAENYRRKKNQSGTIEVWRPIN